MLYIQDFLVVRLYGLMSIFLDSSFLTLMSPSSVFCIRWIVIEDIRSAILCTAIFTSGLSDNLVYPGIPKSSNAPCSLSHSISPGSARFLLNILPILFIKLTYSPPYRAHNIMHLRTLMLPILLLCHCIVLLCQIHLRQLDLVALLVPLVPLDLVALLV